MKQSILYFLKSPGTSNIQVKLPFNLALLLMNSRVFLRIFTFVLCAKKQLALCTGLPGQSQKKNIAPEYSIFEPSMLIQPPILYFRRFPISPHVYSMKICPNPSIVTCCQTNPSQSCNRSHPISNF